jgi:hypothetical protein
MYSFKSNIFSVEEYDYVKFEAKDYRNPTAISVTITIGGKEFNHLAYSDFIYFLIQILYSILHISLSALSENLD